MLQKAHGPMTSVSAAGSAINDQSVATAAVPASDGTAHTYRLLAAQTGRRSESRKRTSRRNGAA